MSVESTRSRFDEAKIDAIFAALDQGQQPGGAVGIAIGGVPVYRKGFGLANMELPVLLGPGMRMRIGSTTKHFAALAYMLLCEDGKATIDDPLGKHLPEVHPVAQGVTMRQLMGHTSGLRDIIAISMAVHGTGVRITDAEMIAYYRTIDDVDFAPGTAWSYNNGGYMLLTAAIERLTGHSLDEVLRSRIFVPLGMNDTLLRRWDTDFVPNSATLHMIDTQGRFCREYMGMEITGAGGIVSSMNDMLVWLKHMDAPVVGSPETWRLIRAPQHLASGHSTGYGLGLVTVPYRGIETVTHAGGVMGGNSQMTKVPSAGLDISIAVNRADANAAVLANAVIDLLVEGLEEIPEQREPHRVSGVYVSPNTGRVVELSEVQGMQMISIDGAPGLPVTEEAGALALPEIMRFLQTRFVPGDEGGSLVEFGSADAMATIALDREAGIGVRAGRYRAKAISADAEISVLAGTDPAGGAGEVRLVLTGRHGRAAYRLESLTETIWHAVPLGVIGAVSAIVTFDGDGDGDGDGQGFDFTAGRMPHIRFSRV